MVHGPRAAWGSLPGHVRGVSRIRLVPVRRESHEQRRHHRNLDRRPTRMRAKEFAATSRRSPCTQPRVVRQEAEVVGWGGEL